MRELSEHSTFVIGLRVDEDGDLRFAIGDNIIEICLTADDEPVALREFGIADAEALELVPWEASKPE